MDNWPEPGRFYGYKIGSEFGWEASQIRSLARKEIEKREGAS